MKCFLLTRGLPRPADFFKFVKIKKYEILIPKVEFPVSSQSFSDKYSRW